MAISSVPRTSKITDIYTTFDDIYLVFTSKKKTSSIYIFSQQVRSSNVERPYLGTLVIHS